MNLLQTLKRIYQSNLSRVKITEDNLLLKKDILNSIEFNKGQSSFKEIEELIFYIKNFEEKKIPLIFIERFCAGKIGEFLLERYPLNVIEAFILSLVILGNDDVFDISLKLGLSGLVEPSVIDGVKENRTEIIVERAFKNLEDSGIIFVDPIYRSITIGNFLDQFEKLFD